jgi:hypothetical protein
MKHCEDLLKGQYSGRIYLLKNTSEKDRTQSGAAKWTVV